jgi:hypothetical protein
VIEQHRDHTIGAFLQLWDSAMMKPRHSAGLLFSAAENVVT